MLLKLQLCAQLTAGENYILMQVDERGKVSESDQAVVW